MHTKRTIADPLHLAALYHAGYGVQWNSYREAATALATRFKMNIGFARIREAVAVSELPSEILAIFNQVGLVNRTARKLVKAAKTEGVSTLVARARIVDSSGKSRATLTAALVCGEVAFERSTRLYKPLLLAKTYSDGLKEGEWASAKEAAETLGIDRQTVAKAISIATLPREVLALFPDVGVNLGERLVHLTKIRGSEKMKALAIEASRTIPRLSQEELIGHFVGLARNKAKVNLRKSGGNLVLEYHLGQINEVAESKISLMAALLNAEIPTRPK
ncbi:hypothetical protein PPGU19_102110 (plasmid) [Paraburkholderia sp. PGU19]|uniref:hypothetical protein n=1 Tax=Paraburkholderia sp. PGU19 TaxID=2735434 RepID=UPI0015DA8C27|nr:hypothetical protein [Paraburkholderia sp. PGU19]BCG05643.1 hypothetical protein PPGU19_102110 [Paraburkholderia sp. PGU19]